jgi:hypothetical protein
MDLKGDLCKSNLRSSEAHIVGMTKCNKIWNFFYLGVEGLEFFLWFLL